MQHNPTSIARHQYIAVPLMKEESTRWATIAKAAGISK